MHRVLNYFVRWNAPICVQIFCTSMRAMSSNALSQPPQPDADLVVLDQTSKVDDLAVALSSWDFPPDAYPNGGFFDGQGKLIFNYALNTPCGLGAVWGKCIEVLLLRKAFLVVPQKQYSRAGAHCFFSFWRSNEFPVGHVANPVPICKAASPWMGHNHASASLAWMHAKIMAGWIKVADASPIQPDVLQQMQLHRQLQDQLASRVTPSQVAPNQIVRHPPLANDFSSCCIKFSPDGVLDVNVNGATVPPSDVGFGRRHVYGGKGPVGKEHVNGGKGPISDGGWEHVCDDKGVVVKEHDYRGKGHVDGGASHGDQGQRDGPRPAEHADEWEHVYDDKGVIVMERVMHRTC